MPQHSHSEQQRRLLAVRNASSMIAKRRQARAEREDAETEDTQEVEGLLASDPQPKEHKSAEEIALERRWKIAKAVELDQLLFDCGDGSCEGESRFE